MSVDRRLRAAALLGGLLAPALALAAPTGAPLAPEWSVALFLGLMGLTVVERLVEVVVSLRNAAWSFARGGVEHGRGHYPAMVALHTAALFAGATPDAARFLAWLQAALTPERLRAFGLDPVR